MTLFAQAIIDGLLIGGIYLIITLGFNLAFGVLGVIDFAVGEWVMLGAFCGYWATQYTKIDPLVFLPLTGFICGIVGWFVYFLLSKVLKQRNAKTLLMVFVFTFGVSIFMKGSALTAWGFNRRSLDTIFSSHTLFLGSVFIPEIRLVAFAFALIVGGGIAFMLYKTRFGLAVQAVAIDPAKAKLMGINVGKVSAIVYCVYAALTGMAGEFIGAVYAITPQMGIKYTIFAFFVAVLAGLGYVPGVLVAAVLLGLIQSLVTIYWGAEYSLLIVFLALYVVLLLAPLGILGKGKPE